MKLVLLLATVTVAAALPAQITVILDSIRHTPNPASIALDKDVHATCIWDEGRRCTDTTM